MKWWSLDFETKSRRDLINEGLDNYVQCPDFDLIVVAARDILSGERFTASAYGDTAQTPYDVLAPILNDPTAQIIAHNAMFEYVVSCVMAKRWGLPTPALSRFHCSSLAGSVVGLPATLGRVAPAVLGRNKVESGKYLINLFSCPNKHGEFNLPEEYPEQWAEYLYYCEVDCDLSAELYYALPPITPETRRYWLATARMNLRGFLLDLEVINKVNRDVEFIKADAAAVTRAITKGLVSKPTERKKLLDFLNSRGYAGESLTSNVVMRWIRDPATDPDIVELLWARLTASKSTFGKYAAFVRYASADRRSRHSFWAAGTHTGRLAGKGVQPQNITYDKSGKLPKADVLLRDYMADAWPEEWDSSARGDALLAMTRAVIMARPGYVFYVVDYASIEARIQVWLAGIPWALRKYRNGDDLYKPMAAIIFGKKVEDVTKAERNAYGKVTVLGCGYGMGPTKFSTQYGKTPEESKRCVYAFRNTYSEIPLYWGMLEAAFKACLTLNRPTKVQANAPGAPVVRFRPDSIAGVPYVVCTPPGRRDIWYRKPEIAPDGQLSYERVTFKGTFRVKIWGGILLENTCQNIAGVIISRGMCRVEERRAYPVLQVHDELVCEIPEVIDMEVEARRKELDTLMVEIDGYNQDFPGLPLAVESHLTERFSK